MLRILSYLSSGGDNQKSAQILAVVNAGRTQKYVLKRNKDTLDNVFFVNLDQKWLVKFIKHDIADKNFICYVVIFLKARVMEGAELQESNKGTPQGVLISTVLANVYLHYVLDLRMMLKVKKMVIGEMYYVWYPDDFIVLFQVEKEAWMVLELLKERLAKFGLQVAEDKTRILPIGRYKGTKENFDFLGLTSTTHRRGRAIFV